MAWLSAEQRAQVVAQSATGAVRTATAVRQWVAQTFGVTYRDGGMDARVGRLRVHPQVPRPVNPQADVAAPAAWPKGA